MHAILRAMSLALGTALCASPALADIVVYSSANNMGTDFVLLSPSSNVTTATGTAGSGGPTVEFTSNSGSGLLTAAPSGQSTISGGTGNTAFTNLVFGLDSGVFTRAVFNINAATNGSVLIHVEGVNISGGFFEDDFSLSANGENFFTVDAINDQFIESISLTAINGAVFEDVRQFRIGGGDVVSAPVPEPGTLALLSAALLTAAAGRRRRNVF